MAFDFLSTLDNSIAGFKFVVGQKWGFDNKNDGFDVYRSIFSMVDNGDGIIQEEEVSLLQRLLSVADTLKPDGTKDNLIDSEEAELLYYQLWEKKIDIEKLRNEVKSEKEFRFPNAEDITSQIDFKCRAGYDVQILKTNSSCNIHDEECSKIDSTYNTYLIKFHDPKTNYDEELKLNFDSDFDEKKISKMISELLKKFDKNLIDTACNETNGLYITPHGGITTNPDYDGINNFNGEYGGFYSSDNETITLVMNGKYDMHTVSHELGHAEDHNGYKYSKITQNLFDMITELVPEKVAVDYILTTTEEMYAEMYADYSELQSYMKDKVDKKYSEIVNLLPDDVKDKFVQALTLSAFKREKLTLEELLNNAGLAEYKSLFNSDMLQREIEETVPSGFGAKCHYNLISDIAKENPEIMEEYFKVTEEIAKAYNNPRNGRKGIDL